ncbi:3,4-dihydroxy-2-butanone-4-phosphate synthase [bacterium]|jgi:3,4-dihydroxy-2-butanone 4-phosphate synthase|nr:3,4-dihydroxy-2-butanone-4-phosphate synthase [bacterium]MBT6831541.1 3,4-dihydroxy-2-butanone-4-phosphate synthase [bacterium]MBT6996099.1 3,4-dihydroxy-2-butanone-4-phosphate synthase [bacterium]MBT7772732.1 3,4-dihydroxy-2-butanone-4-phosphate synthase [bacterium]
MNCNSIDEILEKFSAGKFILVMDEHREIEGDFFALAESITPEQINFLYQHAHGLICVACAPEILDRLKIGKMVENPEDEFSTNFAISVDAAHGISTGVSKFDREKTIRQLASPVSKPDDFVRPGHTFPLRAKNPRERFGHTEASVELAKKCGKIPAVVICEILNEHGEKSTSAELEILAKKFGIATTTLEVLKKQLT